MSDLRAAVDDYLAIRRALGFKMKAPADLLPQFVAFLEHARLRDQLCPRPAVPSFFVSMAGTRLIYNGFHLTFLGLVRSAGLQPRSPSCRPRLHDLRHTFAVRTLLGWYRAGLDVEAQMPLLSTYLGHFHPADTDWYLSAAPELLALAGQRLEHALAKLP